MKSFAYITHSLSPHQMPLCREMVKLLPSEAFRSFILSMKDGDRAKLGWTTGKQEDWVSMPPPEGGLAPESISWALEADVALTCQRSGDFFTQRVQSGKLTFCNAERWFKPPWGMFRLLSPSYFKMAWRFVKLLRSAPNFYYLPCGIHAAADMARLCGLFAGDLRCIFRAPQIDFERKPMGRIFSTQRHRDTEKYCLDKMRMWGYFVEPNHSHFNTETQRHRDSQPSERAESSAVCVHAHTQPTQVPTSPAPAHLPSAGAAARALVPESAHLPSAGAHLPSARAHLPSARAHLPSARAHLPSAGVLWVGRMLDWKRVDTLVQAVVRLLDEGLDIKLHLVGHGPEENKLRKLAKKYTDSQEPIKTGLQDFTAESRDAHGGTKHTKDSRSIESATQVEQEKNGVAESLLSGEQKFLPATATSGNASAVNPANLVNPVKRAVGSEIPNSQFSIPNSPPPPPHSKGIYFHPPVPIAEVRSLMRNADVYVLPSNAYEGWGAVVNEALTEGCAVIATRQAGSSATMIEDGVNGLLFNSGDISELVACLRKMMDAETRTRLSEAGKRTIDEVWSPANAAKSLLARNSPRLRTW